MDLRLVAAIFRQSRLCGDPAELPRIKRLCEEWLGNNAIRSWRLAIGDVNDAGRWLVKQGVANPASLSIVGWSYGGYAALQSGVLDPKLFKAIVAIAPVSDFGKMRESMELAGDATKQALDAVYGDASIAQAGSPARHAADILAPVLLFHGDIDQNVRSHNRA